MNSSCDKLIRLCDNHIHMFMQLFGFVINVQGDKNNFWRIKEVSYLRQNERISKHLKSLFQKITRKVCQLRQVKHPCRTSLDEFIMIHSFGHVVKKLLQNKRSEAKIPLFQGNEERGGGGGRVKYGYSGKSLSDKNVLSFISTFDHCWTF